MAFQAIYYGTGLALAMLSSSGIFVPGCSNAEASLPKPAPSASAAPAPRKEAKQPKHEVAREGSAERKYMVPFSWEAKKDDPLSRTRRFMRDVLSDNATYVKAHPPSFFEPFRDKQHPRATVITCSDSRVQSAAFDQTPEDDLFTIRNIGNQIANSEGSVEYGVHHLKTPVLLVIGHTRCGAVRAAMGDFSGESEPLQKELGNLHVRKEKGKGEVEPGPWLEAVKDNVDAQVARALEQFGGEIEQGNLTVIGAVYDLADDFHAGPGLLHLINVNGNTEMPRLEAFSRAVRGLPPLEESDGADAGAAHAARDEHGKSLNDGLSIMAKDVASLRLIVPARPGHDEPRASREPAEQREPKAAHNE